MGRGIVGTGGGLWIRRKVFHMIVGTIFIVTMLIDDRFRWFYLLVLGAGVFLSLVMDRRPIRILDWFLRRYDKITDLVPGQGPITLFVGILFSWFVFGRDIAAISVIPLAFGDPNAYVFGNALRGPSLPWNRRKTVSGFIAFTITPVVLVSVIWGPLPGLAAGMAGALAESIPFPNRLLLDDNTTIPILVAVTLWALSVLFPGFL